MTTLHDDLALAIKAANSAGQILMDFWVKRAELKIKSKRAGDFVSEADITAENHLRDVLLAGRDDMWLGEEVGATGQGRRRWIVDPLDGTTNFLRGIPHWAISIALEVDGQVQVGVVHDPVHDETFAAALGHGATLNGVPIRPAETKHFSSALFGTGVPFGGMAHIDEAAAQIARLMPNCAGVRRMGAAALDLAYVASGRLDGFWERRLQLWDIAAGLLVLRESGALVEGIDVGESPDESGSVIAATPKLFGQFSSYLRAS
jgi:myo-inositol-1(or 4)-monophosphatase